MKGLFRMRKIMLEQFYIRFEFPCTIIVMYKFKTILIREDGVISNHKVFIHSLSILKPYSSNIYHSHTHSGLCTLTWAVRELGGEASSFMYKAIANTAINPLVLGVTQLTCSVDNGICLYNG